ncbi:MAG: penicillin-binding protein [Bacteroidetes bacterium QS_8_68_28]|nr:MAG: penicillin-binding protein [Bacteroidetes bacterium QS_8_68_28]
MAGGACFAGKKSARPAGNAGPLAANNPRPEPKIRNFFRWFVAVPLALGAALGGAVALWGAAWLGTTAARLPDADGHAAGDPALATVLLSRGGTEIARYYRENRTWTPYRKIGNPVRQALLATEDHRFFDHAGVDGRRLAEAAWQTLRGDRQGGSTITMQLVRNRYGQIADDPPYARKAKEVLMALKLERAFDKKDILEAYLNTVSFGHGAHGIGAAAKVYFDTTAAALGPARAALLVGMLKGPSRYSPTGHPERAQRRRNLVLRQMQKRGFLSERRARRLRSEPLLLKMERPSLAGSPAPHFAEAVRRRAERWAAANGRDFYTGGLRIHTTLDVSMQKKARASVSTQARKLQAVAAYEWSRSAPRLLSEKIAPYVQRAQAGAFEPFARLFTERPALARSHARRSARYRQALRAGADSSAVLERLLGDAAFTDSLRRAVARLRAGLVAVAPQTGMVRAYVGARDFENDQYDKVGLARRQPGSTFKPVVWAAALQHGFAPHDVMRGGELPDPFTANRRRQAGTGGLTLADGLAYSSNRMAKALTRTVGPHEVARTARRLGIRSPLRAVPSLALGTSEVRLLELTGAYAALADDGRPQAPRLITRIAGPDGRTLRRFSPKRRERALSRHPHYTLLDLMRGVIDRGTGRPLRKDWQMRGADLAGKTGTTQQNADGWFLAMHPELVAGAWTGFNDRRVAFRTEHWGHGSSNALRLVGSFLEKIFAAHPSWTEATFAPPPGYRTSRPPRARPLDSAYTGYETVAGAYEADPAATDHRLRDAVGQGLDSTRAGLSANGGARDDELPRRAAAPEAALRNTLPERAPGASAGASEDAARGSSATGGDALQPAPVPAPPTGSANPDSSAPREAPASLRAGQLDERIGTRRDTARDEEQ